MIASRGWVTSRGALLEPAAGLRAVLLTYRADAFSAMRDACAEAGVVVPACVVVRPDDPATLRTGARLALIQEALPAGVDLLMPDSRRGLRRALAGYEPDVLVVLGLNWRLRAEDLKLPRLGVLNIHCSALPRYRGPAPLLASVRNGDREFGVTAHLMDEGYDTGPVMAQRTGLEVTENITIEAGWAQITAAVREILPVALRRLATGDPGDEQDDAAASYAGAMGPDWEVADRSQTAASIHNLVRAHRYAETRRGPVIAVGERRMMLLRTSLSPVEGAVRIDCADAPLWSVEHREVSGG